MGDLTSETFGGTWPYAPRFFDHDRVKLHYVDEGDGEPIVMLHGNPTWGYLYRNFIGPLSETNRCVVPDHMGFGKSEKPLDRPYTLATHVENFTALMDELELNDITLVMQDWGGPIGLGFGVEHADRIKRLVILNTWAFLIADGMPLAPLLELFRQPQVGEAMVQGLNLFVEGFLPTGIHRKEKLDTFMPAYRAPFPDWNSRIGTLAFPRDIPVGDSHPSSTTMRRIQDNLATINVPTTIIWGMQDPAIPPQVIDAWKSFYPHAEEHRLQTASHFLQEDEPERIVELIRAFLQSHS
jgi:pimeloyl-ACP methyl ester carboxylesterase